MRAGDTFRLRNVADKHTWVIVSDPDQDAGRVLCVAFTSWSVNKDPACIVEVEEFSILTNRSCIDYFDVKIASVAALTAGAAKGLIQQRAPVPPELLARIRHGFNVSRDVPFEHIEFLIRQNLI